MPNHPSPIHNLSAPLPVGEGLGVGERAAGARRPRGVEPPSPALPRWGRGLEGRRLEIVILKPIIAVGGEGEGFGDLQDHAIGVAEHIVVPEPDHPVAVTFDHLSPRFISGTIAVLSAIDFDDQLEPAAGEISNGISDLELSRELNVKLLCSQPRPQALRGLGRFGAKLFRYGREALGNQRLYTPTQLSPSTGRALVAENRGKAHQTVTPTKLNYG